MNTNHITCEALILTKRLFGEGHINLSILTKDMGLINASAFGGQRLSKRFKGNLDYFQIVEIEIEHKTKDRLPIFNVSGVKALKNKFNTIPHSLDKFIIASYIQELASILLNPMEKFGKSHVPYFDIIISSLDIIDSENNKEHLLDEAYKLSINLYRETGFLANINWAQSTNAKINHLEEFNSQILGKTPKSFPLLSKLFV